MLKYLLKYILRKKLYNRVSKCFPHAVPSLTNRHIKTMNVILSSSSQNLGITHSTLSNILLWHFIFL